MGAIFMSGFLFCLRYYSSLCLDVITQRTGKVFFIIIIVIIITFIARITIAITNIYSSKNDLLLPKFRLFR